MMRPPLMIATAMTLLAMTACRDDGASEPISVVPKPLPSSTPTPAPTPTPLPTPTPAPTPTSYMGHNFGPPNPADPTITGLGRGLSLQGNLDTLPLGPILRGPINSSIGNGNDLILTVYCPVGANPCNDSLPQGSIYSYVITFFPGQDTPNSPGYTMPPGGLSARDISRFFTNFPVRGITALGLSFDDAIAALPNPNVGPFAFCQTDGRIIWAVPSTGTFDARWSAGERIRFYFQTTSPPASTDGSYGFVAPEGNGSGSAPVPVGVSGTTCDSLP